MESIAWALVVLVFICIGVIAALPWICMRIFQRLVMPGLEQYYKQGMQVMQVQDEEQQMSEVSEQGLRQEWMGVHPTRWPYLRGEEEQEIEGKGPDDEVLNELYAEIEAHNRSL